MKVLVPDAEPFLQLKMPGVQFAPYRRDADLPAEAEGLVLWGLPRGRRQTAFELPSLRWVLTLTAGIDHVVHDLPEHVTLYNASRLHDAAVAQHALSTILAAARGLHRARDAQAQRQWTRPHDLWTLQDRSVVIWGHGHIGRRLAGMLEPLGARITGLRSGRGPGEIRQALAGADVVVLLLPSTPETQGLVNAEVLAQLKPGAWLANFGRGTLVVTTDLQEALTNGQLGGAILDVTDPEPLPEESPLWSLPNVIITPHVASATQDILQRAAMFTQEFLSDLLRGVEMTNRVERHKGY
ncbi:D-2-hydroxyacid dehydrogenase [Deinococcus peraridilitoris]|uniref:Phosphoglycerate dehydrogenase-like oxidoreductase n=1 Tax=Deinococcus peraridilitoris (strain DSM 19664 / LMG 22246 / CIP 109416 / KR-200) TaxID=937777 RepID=L0A707_DEIPD|nr:D-2-hydroxyacid dehydrogenase [Deinococcus peraridilitoris]AFZ68977.1 phosphoglycerate dehydrogenase-like oxidoreductase [Deinococcus peraridilitoris DSM 19664]